MKELLTYILEGITDKDKFEIEEKEDEAGITLNILADPDVMGLIIGKDGNTIKAIQVILRVKARLSNKNAYINVSQR